jgi:predicted phage baseplate assembly protein
MTLPCDCCKGITVLTPLLEANAPGKAALRYRAGTHSSFLASMVSRLSASTHPELAELTTRDPSDPLLAFLDAWATVADVLTFYQERIANEGYLRTATERRSVLELARLVGYTLRPGVASSVYLAYSLEKGYATEIAPGERVQSLPAPGELPQSFETSELLSARSEWNAIKPRQTRPQKITCDTIGTLGKVYLKGTTYNLKANDCILFVFLVNGVEERVRKTVQEVTVQAVDDRTEVIFVPQPVIKAEAKVSADSVLEKNVSSLISVETKLAASAVSMLTVLPASKVGLYRNPDTVLAASSDVVSQMMMRINPVEYRTLYKRLAGSKIKKDVTLVGIFILRLTAPLFGYNAQKKIIKTNPDESTDWEQKDCKTTESDSTYLYLDTTYEKISPGSYVVIRMLNWDKIAKVVAADDVPRTAYGLSAKTTRLTLDTAWCDPALVDITVIRRSSVLARGEPLELTEEPIPDDSADKATDTIELDGLYDGIQSGRWIIVSGERTDIPSTSEAIDITGVMDSELAMVASAQNTVDINLPGDTTHTIITLAKPLDGHFKRSTVTIYANVVSATHGETRTEVLGSGDGSRALQQFALRQTPLTFTSAPTATGIESTLKIRVNNLLWHEADCLEGLAPADRNFITRTDDAGKTGITFGNGVQGARLTTGIENVKAVYRTGIGSVGNVRAGQISLLATKPLGVKGVVNPLAATGGADRETLDQARRNTPLVTMALDRLVSVQDYADYAKTFAGIGKAAARMITDGNRQVVHLTIAGTDDIPIDKTSDLFRNLKLALERYGDPYQPFVIDNRNLLAIFISAKVKLRADYLWEATEPRIRAALRAGFGFDRRELGQSVYLSEVIRVIQEVEGVEYADIRDFSGISEVELAAKLEAIKTSAATEDVKEILPESGQCRAISIALARLEETDTAATIKQILPAQMAYLLPDVPDTLILNEATP